MNHLELNHVSIVTFNTNGYLLDEAMARFLVEKGKTFEHFRISFPLDAATQKTYEKIRGKNLGRTLRNIQFLQDYKRKTGATCPTVFVNMALSRENMKELPDFIKLAHHFEAQVELNNLAIDKGYEAIRIQKGPNLVFDYKKEVPTAHPQPTDRHEISPIRREKAPTYERLPLCLLPWSQVVISSKGDISLCCVQDPFDHLKHYRSIEDAWHSERADQIRGQLSQGVFPKNAKHRIAL